MCLGCSGNLFAQTALVMLGTRAVSVKLCAELVSTVGGAAAVNP